MAHHRVADDKNTLRQRGVSRRIVFVALALLLIVAGIVVWIQIGKHVGREGDAAAAQCAEGPLTVTVLADPDVAPGLSDIAKAYSASSPVIRDRCVTVAVRPADAKITLTALTGKWDDASMGPYPAAWMPQSSIWAAELATAAPNTVDGTPDTLVTSPVVLATSRALGTAVADRLDWAELPTLQKRTDSLAALNLNAWGSLRMAMPTAAQSDATALAAQAVAMRVSHTTGTLTAADASSARVTSSIAALLDAAPRVGDGTPAGAVKALAAAADPAAAAVHAVPITEQRLYQLARADSATRLAEVIPSGPTPFADYPIIHLAGERVPQAASAAIDEFVAFAGTPAQLRILTQQGFRGDAPLPPAYDSVTFPVTNNPMPNPETAAIVAINRQIYRPQPR